MISDFLSQKLLLHFYRAIYTVLSDLNINLPSVDELDFSNISYEQDANYYIVNNGENEDIYTMFVADQDTNLFAGFFLISSFLPLIENMNSNNYEEAFRHARMALDNINRVGLKNVINEVNRLLEGEITIEERVYAFGSVHITIEDAYGSGIEDLMLEAKGINIQIHYNSI